MTARFVLSLDFELFWGVAESRTISGYRNNIEGEWSAIPAMLDLFQRYRVNATWAAVGMLMCRDYDHWREVRPSITPAYLRPECSTYTIDEIVKEYPQLFFARPLVERVLSTPGQELGCHSYSHFYCAEPGVTPAQFAADLACAKTLGDELGVTYRSFVFPRNQVVAEYLPELAQAGIRVYRGNPLHRLYDLGHLAQAGKFRRAMRLADAYLPLSGPKVATVQVSNGLVNCPASFFLRPWSARLSPLEPLRLHRLKRAMFAAAHTGGVFHLWWHPHNFGVCTDENLAVLEALLQCYRELHDKYGMRSSCMGDFMEMAAS